MSKRGAKAGPGTTEGDAPAGGVSPALSSILGVEQELIDAGAPPERLPNGAPNIERLRWEFKQVIDLSLLVALGKREMPKGYNLAQALELLKERCKSVYTIDPKHLMDVRSEGEKIADAWNRIADMPDSAFETLDQQVEAMKRQMNSGDEMSKEMFGGSGTNEALERKLLAKKKWNERLSTLLELRDRARNPVPKGTAPQNAKAVAAVHALRFMVYVGRSSIGADSSVFQVGTHHVKMCVAYWMARNRTQYHDHQWIQADHEGVMLVCPPGHGKSALVSHIWVLEIDQNPRLKGLIGHAQAGMAERNLAYIGSYFDPETANGRRNISLFNPPTLRTLTKDTMDLEDRKQESKSQKTLKAHGITAKVSGSDADFIWFDDPCDQELAEQETTRNRVYDRMNGTWRTRKRGKKTFEIITTTLWHHDDPNSRYLQLIKDNKIKFLASVQKCGGPEQGFKPLWDEQYPTSKLKNIYAEMRNPRLYAAAYQSNPQPAELRKIKRLAYYLPGHPQHARFLESAVFHVSLDPTATNREKSDKASFVYAGINDIVTQNPDGSQSYEQHALHPRRGALGLQRHGGDVRGAGDGRAHARPQEPQEGAAAGGCGPDAGRHAAGPGLPRRGGRVPRQGAAGRDHRAGPREPAGVAGGPGAQLRGDRRGPRRGRPDATVQAPRPRAGTGRGRLDGAGAGGAAPGRPAAGADVPDVRGEGNALRRRGGGALDGGDRRRLVTEDSAFYIPGPPLGPATVPPPPTRCDFFGHYPISDHVAMYCHLVSWGNMTVMTKQPVRWAASAKEGAD
jgi:hypothetical protein